VGAALLDLLSRHDVGVSTLVSLGDASDVGAADVLAQAGDDPTVRVVALYLESVPDPVALHRMGGAVARDTPVLLLTAGCGEPADEVGEGDPHDDAAVDDLARCLHTLLPAD
jgi:acyl-CoA synthetase (NDP forming)